MQLGDARDHYRLLLIMNPQLGNWVLKKYAAWENNDWKEIPSEMEQLALVIKETQVFVVNDSTALESFSLAGGVQNVRAAYSNTSLCFGVRYQNRVSKCRVMFANGTTALRECVQVLNRYVHVSEYHIKFKYDNDSVPAGWLGAANSPLLPDRLVQSYVLNVVLTNGSDSLLPVLNVDDTIQMAVLDPGFPSLVSRVDAFLKKAVLKVGKME